MSNHTEITKSAQAIPLQIRKETLLSYSEVEFHHQLACLLQQMEPNALIEVTHGTDEYGKDLVMVRNDQFGQTVIAVVVKKGAIKGQTKGKIDEIESQVKQAISHPARLKSIKKPLKITKVWVMIVGELFGNAGDRLRNEVEQDVNFRDVTPFDIKWLVDQFTEHYPQVFFEDKIIDFFQSKIQELETHHLFYDRGKTLSECFINPLVLPIEVAVSLDREHVDQSVLAIAKALRKRQRPFIGLKPLVEHHKHTILAGDPGTGKSLALAKLTIDLLKQASVATVRGNTDHIAIPLLIPAKKLLHIERSDDLQREYIANPETFKRYTIAVLLIDALDEAPTESQNDLLEKARRFSEELQCALIVSTRKIDVIKSTPPGFDKYELLPFEFGQALELFKKFAKNPQMLDALREGLNRIQTQVIMTPLSLLMLLNLVEEHDEVPASITELYDRYADTVLGRYDKNKGIEVLFDYTIKERFLASLAFKEFYEKNRLEMTWTEFERFVQQYLEDYSSIPSTGLQSFLSELKRSGILNCGDHLVAFWHRSFLDYFVAHYIFDNREHFDDVEALIVTLYFDNMWGDVAFFYSGLKKDVSLSMLRKIFTDVHDDLETYAYKFMAGRLLQAAWHSPQKVQSYGIEEIVKLVPVIRARLLAIIKQTQGSIPEIAADIMIMFLSDFSLRSAFLQHEVTACFQRLQQGTVDADQLYMMVALLWALQKILPEQDMTLMVQTIMTAAKQAQLTFKDESAIFILLNVLERTDKALIKSIERHLGKLQVENTEAFQKVMPKQVGYRKALKKHQKQCKEN